MTRKFVILLAPALLASCGHTAQDLPDRGLTSVNQPVVSRTDYVFDAAAPGGMLDPAEASRLDNWFQGLDLRYGDNIYVDGAYAEAARGEVARAAGRYGLLVNAGAPVTQGMVPEGMVRVVVSRNVASVPNCPNWSRSSDVNYNNRYHPNFGCAVNSNLAAMIGNPEDLIHGRDAGSSSVAKVGTGTAEQARAKALSNPGLPSVVGGGNSAAGGSNKGK